VRSWVRDERWRPTFRSALEGGALAAFGVIDVDGVPALFDDPPGDGDYLIWQFLMLELWARLYLTRTASAAQSLREALDG
jgi:hypothetical protein|tara:strand:+ start:240 stop:479 length:240 start_codon:yes stop_codon:yes gene_type:complete